MKKDFFDMFLKIILILGMILVIYWFIQLMIGGSPVLSQFNSVLIVMVIGILFKLNREFGEFKMKTINGFTNVRKDYIFGWN